MKIIFVTLLILNSAVSLSQTSFGIKGGLNYNSNGELKEITIAGENILKDRGNKKAGYHIGIFIKKEIYKLYIKPELSYAAIKSEYQGNNYDIKKLDLPVLVGFKLIGSWSLFAGPSLQYILDNSLEGVSISDVENEFTVGVNFGTAIQFGRLGLDFRYERGLNKNEASFINAASNSVRLDSKPEQLIFSISVDL